MSSLRAHVLAVAKFSWVKPSTGFWLKPSGGVSPEPVKKISRSFSVTSTPDSVTMSPSKIEVCSIHIAQAPMSHSKLEAFFSYSDQRTSKEYGLP